MSIGIWIQRLVVAGLVLIFAGCSEEGKDHPQVSNRVKEDFCPASKIQPDEMADIVKKIRTSSDEVFLSGVDIYRRAGFLAAELARLGVSKAEFEQSLKNQKFFAMVTWLGSSVKSVDFVKFSNCERF